MGNKISASGVSPKWVKSNERREKEEREKVSDYNGQYITPELKSFKNHRTLIFGDVFGWPLRFNPKQSF